MRSRKIKRRKRNRKYLLINNSVIKTAVLRIVVLFVAATISWGGISAIGNTLSYLNDTQESPVNNFSAATLNFSLDSPPDFSPEVTPDNPNATRDIHVANTGILDFNYKVKIADASGMLCDYLNLSADLDSVNKYSGALNSFAANGGKFSDSGNHWNFTATLTSNNPTLQSQACTFNFVYSGEQIGGAGFSDQEIILNTITSGVWQKVVINKVYYDPDASHGTDLVNEWIELYNILNAPINISGWKVCDNTSCDIIPSSDLIPAHGFAVITGSSSTFNYWDIPSGVVKIVLVDGKIGNGLSDSSDRVILKTANNVEVDAMSYGTDEYAFNPACPDVARGHILARVPTGLDTNAASDWKDLALPRITVVWPNGGEVLYVGRTYTLKWSATNSNGPDTDLSIDIWYSSDSGSTWANIARGAPNNGAYSWRVPLCLDDGKGGCYSVVSHMGRIKVVAWGPENFMVQAWDISNNDFCPPIDYSLLTDQEKAQVEQMLSDGTLTSADIVNRDVNVLPAAGSQASADTTDSQTDPSETDVVVPSVGTLVPDTSTDNVAASDSVSEQNFVPVATPDSNSDTAPVNSTLPPDPINSPDATPVIIPAPETSTVLPSPTDSSSGVVNNDSAAGNTTAGDTSDATTSTDSASQ